MSTEIQRNAAWLLGAELEVTTQADQQFVHDHPGIMFEGNNVISVQLVPCPDVPGATVKEIIDLLKLAQDRRCPCGLIRRGIYIPLPHKAIDLILSCWDSDPITVEESQLELLYSHPTELVWSALWHARTQEAILVAIRNYLVWGTKNIPLGALTEIAGGLLVDLITARATCTQHGVFPKAKE